VDCLRTAEVIMAERDGEPVTAEEAASAHQHCASCAECTAFAATLDRLSAISAPRASAELVERLVAMSAEAAADIREAEIASRALAEAGLASAPAPEETRGLRLVTGRWTPRFSAFAAAAAVVLVALGVGAIGLTGMFGARQAGSDDSLVLESVDTPTEDGTRSETMATAPAPLEYGAADRSALTAPPYVAFRQTVWVQELLADTAPSGLTTAGVVISSLSESGEAAEHTAFLTADGSALWVARDDGGYAVFSPVIRTVGLKRYALASEVDLPRFGMWPSLPSRFATPQRADGSPSFAYFGFDDLNRDIYVPINGRIEDGFALPPSGPDDPAGGNPGWTWWVPAD